MNTNITKPGIIILVALLGVLFTNSLYGQTNKNAATFFLDSKEIDLNKVYFSPGSIDSIFVNKDPGVRAVFFYSKKPPMKFITLDKIIRKHTDYKALTKNMVFIINDELKYDIDGILVDKNYHIYVKAEPLDKVTNIKDIYKEILLIHIDLEKDKRKRVIHIRGGYESLLQK